MTRREMVERCVQDQIRRGVVPEEEFEELVRVRLNGGCGMKPMSKSECERWYRSVFEDR